MLFMYIDKDHKTWDTVLPFLTFAYNMACQDITGFSPLYLLYGHDASTIFNAILLVSDMSDYSTTVVSNADQTRQLAWTRTGES